MPRLPPARQFPKILGFARHLVAVSGRRAFLALGYLLLGSLTEGISILLLIPILQYVGRRDGQLEVAIPTERLHGAFGGELRLPLVAILAGLVVLIVLQSLLMRAKGIYMSEMLQRFVTRTRLDIFEAVTRARWRMIAGQRGAQLHHVVTASVDRVQAAGFQTLLLVQNAVLLAAYLLVSCLVSPAMTALAFLSGALILVLLHPVRRRAEQYGKLLTQNNQAQAQAVSEFLNGLKVAKSFNAEPRYLAEHEQASRMIDRAHSVFVRASSTGAVIFQTSNALFLALFAYLALSWLQLSLPEIAVLLLLFLRIAPRFMSLQSGVQEILTNLPAFDAMQDLREQCARDHEELRPAAPAPELSRQIELRGAGYRYGSEGTAEALSGVDLVIPAGAVTALIGPSGSGKSTLADLVMGLTSPTAGDVRIDGATLDDDNRRAWREHVAYVPQDVFLLNDTIAANLRLAAPDAAPDAMWTALELAQAAGFVRALPGQLDTLVGDRGGQLSGGERQRIALARALLRKPRLLVLDEATSALDWESQRLIATAIETLRGSLTILTVAHRVSMIAFADHVAALEHGRIVEAGPYARLAADPHSRLAGLIAGERGAT